MERTNTIPITEQQAFCGLCRSLTPKGRLHLGLVLMVYDSLTEENKTRLYRFLATRQARTYPDDALFLASRAAASGNDFAWRVIDATVEEEREAQA